jgi:two-component system, LytTR family, response regulator
MGPLTVLIADSDSGSRRHLEARLKTEPELKIVGEVDDAARLAGAIHELAPKAVFLSADDGAFAALHDLGGAPMPLLVVTARSDAFAMKGFEIGALDYLIKPLADEVIARAVARARYTASLRDGHSAGSMAPRRVKRIALRLKDRVSWVSPCAVDWFQADGNYARVYTGGRTHLIRASMSAIEQRLDPDQFIRVNRSAIVNVDRVRKAVPNGDGEYDLVLADEVTTVPLSRRYRAALEFVLGTL